MASPFSGGTKSTFSKFTSLEGQIFNNREILIILFFIFYILTLCSNSVKNFRAITLFNLEIFNFEIFLTEKKPIFEVNF